MRTGRRLLISLFVVVGLLVAADRIGVLLAEDAVATTVQDSQHLSQKPDVDITGFPFLTQLVAGKFGKVTLADQDVPVGTGRRTLALRYVHVTLTDVRVARDFTSATAGRVSATAIAGYPALSRATGLTVSYAGAGRVRAAVTEKLAGQQLRASVTVRPVVRDDTIVFTDPRISAGGRELPSAVSRALAGVFGAPIPLAALPYGLTVRSLTTDRGGLHLALSARQLTVRR